MKAWRKVHLFSFGYFKFVSMISSCILLIIALTGILYNHMHDFAFLEQARIPTSVLPDSYQERLDRTRKAQGLGDLFPEEAHSVPIMWVVIDLHNGEFFGGLPGRLFYDLVALSLGTLSVTGIVMYWRIRKRVRW
jgi:uncharacterized iron-regulated membrane protein